MNIDNKAENCETRTLTFPYGGSASDLFCVGLFFVVLGGGFSLMICMHGIHDGITDLWGLSYEDKKALIGAVVLFFIGLFFLGYIPALMNAGDLNSLHISPEGITLPKGYFEIRHVFVAAADIKSVKCNHSRGYITIRHKGGTDRISKGALRSKEKFELVWQLLQQIDRRNASISDADEQNKHG